MSQAETPAEFQVHRISMGSMGKDEKGNPIEAVVIEYSLPSGYRSQGDWPMDLDDRQLMGEIANRFEQKIRNMHEGRATFVPNSVMGFDEDKR